MGTGEESLAAVALTQEFIERMSADPAGALEEVGVQPTLENIAALEAIDKDALTKLMNAWLAQASNPRGWP